MLVLDNALCLLFRNYLSIRFFYDQVFVYGEDLLVVNRAFLFFRVYPMPRALIKLPAIKRLGAGE